MEAIKIKSMGGIKCDNPKCTYKDESVCVDEYPQYLNKPCPICGENLLTEADYKSFMTILKVINGVNFAADLLPNFAKKNSKKESEVRINFDGSGKFDITNKPK